MLKLNMPPPSSKRIRLHSIARRRSSQRPSDTLESFVRSIRHAEDRLRGDLRSVERSLASEKDYSSKVKRERDELRKEVTELSEERSRRQEEIRDLKTQIDALQTKIGEAQKEASQRDGITERKVTTDLQRQVEKHLRTMMLEMNGTFKASGLVFDPEVTSESESEAKPVAEEVKQAEAVAQAPQAQPDDSEASGNSDVDVTE